MNRNSFFWLAITFLASVSINLAFHNPLITSILNALSLSLALLCVLPFTQGRSMLFPLFSLIPLYYFAPRYPAISFLELAAPLGLLRPRLFPVWIPIIILCVLLQGNIVNLPRSFDHERLIAPTTEYKLAVKRQIEESLYLPYKLREPLAISFGLTNLYLTNFFSFISFFNFYQTLLLTNTVLAVVGLSAKFNKLLISPLILALLVAGATKLPDKTLFLFTARSSLLLLTWLGISKLNLSPRRYFALFILGLVFTAYAWI